jgi:hypothetical protein
MYFVEETTPRVRMRVGRRLHFLAGDDAISLASWTSAKYFLGHSTLPQQPLGATRPGQWLEDGQ